MNQYLQCLPCDALQRSVSVPALFPRARAIIAMMALSHSAGLQATYQHCTRASLRTTYLCSGCRLVSGSVDPPAGLR